MNIFQFMDKNPWLTFGIVLVIGMTLSEMTKYAFRRGRERDDTRERFNETEL